MVIDLQQKPDTVTLTAGLAEGKCEGESYKGTADMRQRFHSEKSSTSNSSMEMQSDCGPCLRSRTGARKVPLKRKHPSSSGPAKDFLDLWDADSSDSENQVTVPTVPEDVGLTPEEKYQAGLPLSEGEMAVCIGYIIHNRPKTLLGDIYNANVFENALCLVRSTYRTIYKENKRILKTITIPDFAVCYNTAALKTLQHRTMDDVPVIPMCLEDFSVDMDTELDTILTCTLEEGDIDLRECYEVRCVHLPSGDNFVPPLRPLIHLECNIRVFDTTRVKHMAQIDNGDSMKMFFDLFHSYEEGVFGDVKAYGYLNRWMLYNLLLRCYKDWTESKSHIHCAIFTMFPDVLTFRELEWNGFDELEARFNNVLVRKEKLADKEQFIGDNASDSARTLLCNRCCVFACQLHDPEDMKSMWPLIPLDEFRLCKSDKPIQEECSEHCWKLSKHRKIKRCNRRSRDELMTSLEPFFPIDKKIRRLFFTYMQVAGKDTCSFASALRDRWRLPDDVWISGKAPNCNQLYALSCKYWELSEDLPLESKELKIQSFSVPGDEQLETLSQNMKKERDFWAQVKGEDMNKSRFRPCSHEGACKDNPDCECVVCTKCCACTDCTIRFPGCHCEPGGCNNRQCSCFIAKWECDPSTCLNCNCGPNVHIAEEKPLSSTLKLNESQACFFEYENQTRVRCQNVKIRTGQMKKVKMGVSSVAGWGCFLDESADEGDLIGEYMGELISTNEAERRGILFDRVGVSYIFRLNEEQAIDGSRFSSLMRYANHSSSHANLLAQIPVVEEEHRVVFYAKRRIEKDEELFFDYGYEKCKKKMFVDKEPQLSRAAHLERFPQFADGRRD